ncbi:hypothetical protein PQR29_03165 [Paraburkholderia strydomiana]|uniref:hypothetical protein n=1 Tax=Paraburkholderia strydomiana TaxID=1245417 RepID=UPI0038BB1A8A
MPRLPVPLSAVEPDVYLSRWRIFETDDGLKRLVGYDSVDQGRVSSALVEFNPKASHVQTSDGLTYRLLGEPGFFWEIIDTWDVWFHAITGGTGGGVTDVTERMLAKSVVDDDAPAEKSVTRRR